MLYLRGAPALSEFRRARLQDLVRGSTPAVSSVEAEFAHFAQLRAAVTLTRHQQQILERVLSERAKENMKETIAKLAPKYCWTGRMKTGNPLLTADLLMEVMMAPKATIHQP